MMQDEIRAALVPVFERHEMAFLQFSGGKDSLAVLHLCQPWWNQLSVVWVNTGDTFPETRFQMEGVKAAVPHFLEIRSDQPAHIKRHGWPVDLLPISSSAFGKLLERHDRPVLTASPICCAANVWEPMQKAIAEYAPTLIIRGAKDGDKRRGPEQSGEIIEGVERCFPLWKLTDAQVRELIAEMKIRLPAHYSETETSLDCMHCTAYLDENAGKMRYLAKHHPDVSTVVQGRLRLISAAVNEEVKRLQATRI